MPALINISFNQAIIVGVDRKPENDLEKVRYEPVRHGEFGANQGDEELVNLIYLEGVKQPPYVRMIEPGVYEVLDGCRRVLAGRAANARRKKNDLPALSLPVLVADVCNDLEAALAQVELNINREEDDPISLGMKFKMIVWDMTNNKINPMGYPDAIKKLSSIVKCSDSKVRQYMTLPDLEASVQDQVRKKEIGIGAAVALVKLAPHAQVQAATNLLEKGKGKDAEEARKVRDSIANKEEKAISKPPKVPPDVWRTVVVLYDTGMLGEKSAEFEAKIDAIRICLGDLPIGHDPELLEVVQKATEKGIKGGP